MIADRRKWVHQMRSTVRDCGYDAHLSGFYPVELGVNDFQTDSQETGRWLIAAGRQAVEEDHAEALILGCTVEVGFYKEVEIQLGEPVTDLAIAALKPAEYADALKRYCGWVPSRRWWSESPQEDEIACFGQFVVNEAFCKSHCCGSGLEERRMPMSDAERRLAQVRAAMRETRADLLAIGPGSHMQWLLGFHPHADERLCLLLVGPEKQTFLMPALNAEGSREATDIEFHTWTDDEGPSAALARALAAIGSEHAKTVVLDETMRADFALLVLDTLPACSHRSISTTPPLDARWP